MLKNIDVLYNEGFIIQFTIEKAGNIKNIIDNLKRLHPLGYIKVIIYEENQTLLKSNVLDIDFVLKKIVEYGVARYNEGLEEAIEDAPDCDNCDKNYEPIPWDDLG